MTVSQFSTLTESQINQRLAQLTSNTDPDFDPCNRLEHAWPLVIKFHVALIPCSLSEAWQAISYPGYLPRSEKQITLVGKRYTDRNPLKAAMLAILAVYDAMQLDL